MFKRSGILVFCLCGTLAALAQDINDAGRFPPAKGYRKVVKKIAWEKPSPLFRSPEVTDTLETYLLNGDGRIAQITSYDRLAGGAHTLHRLTYNQQGELASDTCFDLRFNTTTQPESYTSWQYTKGQVTQARSVRGKELNQSTTSYFTYDNQGRKTSEKETHIPPRKTDIPGHDSVFYRYQNDTAYATAFHNGATEKYQYYVRFDAAGRQLAFHAESKDKKMFDHATTTYDNKGRITESIQSSHMPAIQDDGVVLRAERIMCSYDAQGKLVAETAYAGGKECWKYVYIYLR
jgi:hypothetical protein